MKRFFPCLNRRPLKAGVFLLCVAAVLSPVFKPIESRAAALYVPNPSFESQVTPFADPRIDSWQKPPQPPTFDTNTFGAWDNLAGLFFNPPLPNPDHVDNAAGNQLAYLFAYPGIALFQDNNSTDWSNVPPTHAFNPHFEPGKSYRLTAGFTSSREQPLSQGSTLQMSLYYRDAASNIVTVASTTVTYDTNVFTNITHLLDFQVNVPMVQSNQAWAGQYIGIQFQSTTAPSLIGGAWDLDNVRLVELIPIANFSFESQPTALADPRVDSWQKPPQPAGFDTNIFGAWANLAGVFQNPPSGPEHIDNADGNQLAYLFAYPQLALFQDHDSTDWSGGPPSHAFAVRYKPGRSYVLAAGLTSSSEEPLTAGSTLQISLYYRDALSNLVTVASTIATYDTNVFTNLTHLIDFRVVVPEVGTNDPWAGQYIGISFQSVVAPNLIGGVWDIDNVRLTETVATAMGNSKWVPGQFSFALQSEPGLVFDILSASNASQPAATWTRLDTLTNTSGLTTFNDTGAGVIRGFYRARLVP